MVVVLVVGGGIKVVVVVVVGGMAVVVVVVVGGVVVVVVVVVGQAPRVARETPGTGGTTTDPVQAQT